MMARNLCSMLLGSFLHDRFSVLAGSALLASAAAAAAAVAALVSGPSCC